MNAVYSITKGALKRNAQHTILGGGAYREGNWTHATREQCHTDLPSYLGLSKRALLAVSQQQAYKAEMAPNPAGTQATYSLWRHHLAMSNAMPPTRQPRNMRVCGCGIAMSNASRLAFADSMVAHTTGESVSVPERGAHCNGCYLLHYSL